jgi:hypothetical protein
MTVTITVKNVATGSTVKMEVEPNETIGDIIDSAADFWKKEPSAYILKKGKSMLRGSDTVSQLYLQNGDVLEMVPDPEGGSA